MLSTTNVHLVQVPYTNNVGSVNHSCSRKCAQISAWILLVVHGFLFTNFFYKMINSPQGHEFKDGALIWDPSTQELKENEGILVKNLTGVKSFHDQRYLTLLGFALGFGFSILLLIGVQKKISKLILVWIIYFITSCITIFFHIIWQGEKYTNFEKVVTVKIIVLSFILFFLIVRYYKVIVEMEATGLPNNLREVKATVADPMAAHLQPHLHTLYQPYSPPPYVQNEILQPNYVPKVISSYK